MMAARTASMGNQKAGVAIAALLHVLIIGLLSVQWTAGNRRFDNPPMEVDLIAETAPQSTAPVISETPPAARLGDELADDIAAPPEPAPPEPEPLVQPKPAPAPAPKAVAKPAPKPQPAPRPTPKPTPKVTPKAAPKEAAKPAPPKAAPKSAPAPAPAKKASAPAPKAPAAKSASRPTGRLDGIVDGLSKAPPKAAASKGAPAAATAAEVKKSIDVAIDGKILPFWRRNVPSGIDIDQLRVVLRIQLSRDGRVMSVAQVGDLTGRTDSNAPQQQLFIERAERSIRQAAPFDLPDEYYDQWKVWDVTFRAKGI